MKSTFNDTVPTVYEASNKRQEHNEQEFWNNAGIVYIDVPLARFQASTMK